MANYKPISPRELIKVSGIIEDAPYKLDKPCDARLSGSCHSNSGGGRGRSNAISVKDLDLLIE